MTGLGLIIGQGIAAALINEWLAWQEKKQRPAGYVWTAADVSEFIRGIDADTPEAIEAEVRARKGLPPAQ